MNAEHLNHLCDTLLAMLDDGPREDVRMGKHAAGLLHELIATSWRTGRHLPAVPVNEQLVGYGQTAADGFERWFGPQPLEGEPEDKDPAGEEDAIRRAVTSLRA